jgi:uncharacterized protein
MGGIMRGLMSLLLVGLAVYLSLALYLFVFQARHVYFPDLPSREVNATPADIGLDYETVRLVTEDGETLAGWYIPAPDARATLLYLHGNGGNIAHRLDPISVFHGLGLNILIIDYRGYGDSSGKPDEAGTYQDALAAWNHLTRDRRLRPQQIVLFGESLGGSIAAWLAARHTPAATILYASFTSVPDMAQALYPMFPARWLARYRYDTRASLGDVTCPLLILHSPEDEIVPFSHGRALFDSANPPKQLVELRGGHNDALLLGRELFAREVDGLLQQVFADTGDARGRSEPGS